MRALGIASLTGIGTLLFASTAFAQGWGQPRPQPGYGQPSPGYGQPSPGYGHQSRRPPPGYQPVQNYSPSCCEFSVRFNPLDLVLDGSVVGEFEWAPLDFISFEVAPKYRFGLPGLDAGGVDVGGFGMGLGVAFWLNGTALSGYYLKPVVRFERYSVNSNIDAEDRSFGYTMVGGMLGSQSFLVGNSRDGGLTLATGFGIGHFLDHRTETVNYQEGPSTIKVDFDPAMFETLRIIGQISLGYTW